jgi:hypothetical protein
MASNRFHQTDTPARHQVADLLHGNQTPHRPVHHIRQTIDCFADATHYDMFTIYAIRATSELAFP